MRQLTELLKQQETSSLAKIEELKEKNVHLEEQVREQLSREIEREERLGSALLLKAEAEGARDRLLYERDSLKADLEALCSNYSQESRKTEELAALVKTLALREEMLKEELETTSLRAVDLSFKLEAVEKAELQSKANGADSSNPAIQELDTLHAECERRESLLYLAQAELEGTKTEFLQTLREKEALQSELENYRNIQHATTGSDVDALKASAVLLESELEETNKKYQATSEMLTQVNTHLASSKERALDLERLLSDSQQETLAHEATIAELKAELEATCVSLRAALEEVETKKIAEHRDSVPFPEKPTDETQSLISDLNQDLEEQRHLASSLRQELSSNAQSQIEQAKEAETLRADLATLAAKNAEQELSLANTMQDKLDLETRIASMQRGEPKLEAEVSQLKAELENEKVPPLEKSLTSLRK